MVKSLTYTLIAVSYLLFLNATLVGILFAGLFVLCLFASGFRRITSRLNVLYLQEKAKLAQISEEVFNNIRTVKAFNSEYDEI
jgi:ABC-type bacteriocin/lantibiotic exporter with double-glycine peptidase domain